MCTVHSKCLVAVNYILSCIVLAFYFLGRGPPADHWALVSGLPTYVAENGFVSPCPIK